MDLTPFEKYMQLNYALHALIEQGKSETDEADDVRDQMDEPWDLLTDNQRKIVREESEILYDLADALNTPFHQALTLLCTLFATADMWGWHCAEAADTQCEIDELLPKLTPEEQTAWEAERQRMKKKEEEQDED